MSEPWVWIIVETVGRFWMMSCHRIPRLHQVAVVLVVNTPGDCYQP